MIQDQTSRPSNIWARVFESTPALERWIVLFRMGASPVLALLVVISRGRLPYWEAALAAFAITFVVNLMLFIFLRRRHYLTVAAIGTLLDTVLLLVISNMAIRASARMVSTSELWLIYPVVIMAAAYRFRPLFSILYALLLSAWYGVHIAVFFSPGSRPYTELPVRVGFFLLIGVLATLMSYALRKEAASASTSKPEAP